MIKKNIGPSLVPCGTDAFNCCQDDFACPSLTRKLRSVRKSAHQ